eukprot:gene29686-5099_t
MKKTGEFDASATIITILRVRRCYPKAKPAEDYDIDQDFRNFVNCNPALVAVAPQEDHGSLCSMFTGPLQIRFRDTCPNAEYYFRRKMGPPGGAICVGAENLASCPRFDH